MERQQFILWLGIVLVGSKYIHAACNCPIAGNASSGAKSHNANPERPCSSNARAAVRPRVPAPPVTINQGVRTYPLVFCGGMG